VHQTLFPHPRMRTSRGSPPISGGRREDGESRDSWLKRTLPYAKGDSLCVPLPQDWGGGEGEGLMRVERFKSRVCAGRNVVIQHVSRQARNLSPAN